MRLIDEITAYLNFLIFSQKLDVCICDIYRSLPPAWCEAFSSFVHTNPYCQKIKHLKNGQRQCFLMQQFVRKHCLEDRVFFGNCYAGVSEYIFPIVENGKYYGFISVSGYRRDNFSSFFENSFDSAQKHADAYLDNLTDKIPPRSSVATLIAPLVNNLKLLLYHMEESGRADTYNQHDLVYQTIVQFLSENYLRRLTLTTISEELHYSISYISQIFSAKNERSVMQYVQFLKINKAKELLENTTKSIMEIAEIVGFEDSNYFTNVFRKLTGVSPRNYRKKSIAKNL